MSGVFINYRRGDHADLVRELYGRLEHHFGEDQVFRDVASLVPGQRYPDALRDRVADCEVLLVVVHEGWTEARDEAGTRRLDREDDWVRLEIEQALRSGKTVIPLLLDDAAPPLSTELPDDIRDLAHRQAHRLRREEIRAQLTELIAVLESHVAPTWQPIPAPPPHSPRSGWWLGAGTAVLAAVILLGVPAIPWGDDWARTDELPFTLYVVGWCCLLMCAPLVSIGLVSGPFGRSVDSLEREMHTVKQRTYVRKTWPVALALILTVLISAFSTQGDAGVQGALVVVLCAFIGVGRAAATSIRIERREKDLWARWPQGLPSPVHRRELRRAVTRLELRMNEWLRPLSREQREKAEWELAEIGRALTRVKQEATRSRAAWLVQDHPWLLSFYALWLTLVAASALETGFAYRAAGLDTTRIHVALAGTVLFGLALSLATMEVSYRGGRRARTELVHEVAGNAGLLAERVASLSSPVRTRPSAPAPRPEEHAEPD